MASDKPKYTCMFCAMLSSPLPPPPAKVIDRESWNVLSTASFTLYLFKVRAATPQLAAAVLVSIVEAELCDAHRGVYELLSRIMADAVTTVETVLQRKLT